MKVKITRPDGTVIEAEGTAEEIERLVNPVKITIDFEKLKPAISPSPAEPYIPGTPIGPSFPYSPTIKPWQPDHFQPYRVYPPGHPYAPKITWGDSTSSLKVSIPWCTAGRLQ